MSICPTLRSYVVDAGISVVPLKLDGTKAPAVQTWNKYRKRFPHVGELLDWSKRKIGLGLVCGVQSGGLEVLDFDEEPDATFNAWLDLLPAAIRGLLCVVETGGLGYHVIYRCSEVCGNSKIAMTEPRGEKQERGVLIESRGEGGYIVAAGSPLEVHSSGNAYAQVMGRPLPEVPTFTREQRKTLWQAAASFDHRTDPMGEYVKQRAARLRPAPEVDPATPWGDFDIRASWGDILTPHGWRTADGIHWTRPGKNAGESAKVKPARNGTEVLWVFSTSAGPLAASGGPTPFGKFRAFTALEHRGNNAEAIKAARRKGYGSPS